MSSSRSSHEAESWGPGDGPPPRAAVSAAPPLESGELPRGWRTAEADDWDDEVQPRRWRPVWLRVGFALALLAAVAGVLIWVAAGHYGRGVAALEDGAYSRAISEFSAANVVVFPYRDARALQEQAQRALDERQAALQADQARVDAVVAGLERADRRLKAGDAVAVLATLQGLPPADLKLARQKDDAAAAAATVLAEDLTGAATAAMERAAWVRAGQFAAAYLVLDPSDEAIAALAQRARTGEKLRAQLADAKAAARRGQWRAALRLALAVTAVRKDFPGAAALVADARAALAPPPKPTPTPTPTPVAPPPPRDRRRDDHAPPAAAAMRRPAPTRSSRLARAIRRGLVIVVACLAALWAGAAVASAQPWAPLTTPWGTSWTAYDAWAFGSASLAVTGDDGHIAVTRNAGGTWKVVVPRDFETAAFTAVAIGTSGRGAVASGGLLLVTDDFGATWAPPVYIGPGPGAAINDIALRGSRVVAVGDDGVIMSSSDAGATWSHVDSPTASRLTAVAIAGDGTGIAGSAAGEILTGQGETWTVVGGAGGAVTSVAAVADPTWGDAQPDLVVATGNDLLGSDDALTFATLPGLPDAATRPWSVVAWSGVPARSLLVAGGQRAGYFETVGDAWVPGSPGLTPVRAVTPAGQSVGYVLGADGRLARTLSAAREPAVATLGKSRITVGGATRLTATVSVGAPGTMLVRARIPGRAWGTLQSLPWTAADWGRGLSIPLSPTLTHEYSLWFRYGGADVQLTQPVKLTVVPKVLTAKARYDLRRGAIFRFSGTVSPRLRGESVELLTDRGGSWRPISLQTAVKLSEGRTWTSRQFGTPRAETYRLRAHLKATKAHAEAWSRIVTVSIR